MKLLELTAAAAIVTPLAVLSLAPLTGLRNRAEIMRRTGDYRLESAPNSANPQAPIVNQWGTVQTDSSGNSISQEEWRKGVRPGD